MIAAWDDTGLLWDDRGFTWDGVGGVSMYSTSELLAPQQLLNQKVPAGSQWSKEEAERWASRLRRTPKEMEKELQEEEEERVGVMMLALMLWGL